jgi:hypothetical protein
MKTLFDSRERRALFYVLFAFLCGNSFSFGQIHQAWVAKYNNGITNGTNQAVKMVLDAAGNIYVTGFSQNVTNGNLDYATIKYIPNGTQVWASRYVATNTSTAETTGLVLDSGTNIIVTGSFCTIKYDPDGNQLWTSHYAGNAIAVDGSNNVFVAVFRTNLGVAKLNMGGTNQWEIVHAVAYIATNLGKTLCVDSNGDSFLASYISFYNGTVGPYYYGTVTKYDPNGNQIWYQQYYSANYLAPIVQATTLDALCNFYVLVNFGPGGIGYQTMKFAGNNGSLTWTALDPTGNGFSIARSFALDILSDIWVTGSKYSAFYEYTNTQYGTYGLNTNGAYICTNLYPSYPSGFPAGMILSAGISIAVDQGNNVYVTGYSPGTNSGNDIVTIKYGSNGNQIWLQRYNGPGNGDDEGNAIAVDALGNVYCGRV